jgi:hypothetical protein
MKTTILLLTLLSSALFLSACVNKHGISMKYYSDCKEYYDLQGYYHKECGEDDIITYKEMKDAIKKKEPEPTSNVW